MKKDMIFFSNNGLTSTSANHVANLAKEYISKQVAFLENLQFYKTTVSIIGSNNPTIIQHGNTDTDVLKIEQTILEIAKAHSLIAWLREAIKAKERLLHEVSYNASEQYLEIHGITLPKNPVMGKILTEDEYYSSLSIKERNRYYELETEASTLGKYIHPNGAFATTRKDLSKVILKPHEVEGNGRDTIVYSYIPTVNPTLVEDIFFKLQKVHRETQAKLNKIKHECEKAIKASEAEVHSKYAYEMQVWRANVDTIEAEIAKYKTEKLNEINNYKIIIPDSLKDIYELVSQLGK